MQSYRERTKPAFQVRYRFLLPSEGGRESPPRQHIRWDFLYEGDDPSRDGISMIWPEFISSDGAMLSEGEVPLHGLADMFIVNGDLIAHHRSRITVGTKGYFVEGAKRVAQCEVTAVLSALQSDAI